MEKKGVLFKKGRGALGTILSAATQWKARYCVLSAQEGCMRYYSDNSMSKLLGAVDLTQAYVNVQEARVRKSALQITSSLRSWWFAAASDAERDDWIKALRNVLEEKKLLQANPTVITKVLGFGSNNLGQLGHVKTSPDKFAMIPSDTITSIAVGDSFSLAVVGNGTLFAWGWAASGRLCVKADADDSATGEVSARKSMVKPPPVQWQPRPVLPALFGGPNVRITQVACCAHNGFALTDTGALWTWGRAGSCLGLGSADANNADKHHPVQIPGLQGLKVVRIAACQSVAAAIVEGGKLYMWGQSEWMESGTFNSWEAHAPEAIDAFGGVGVHSLAIGHKHFVALLEDKTIHSWGCNDHGQLGHGNLERQKSPKRIEYLGDTPIDRVFAGPDYSMAISGGRAIAWGNAANGVLGVRTDQLKHDEQFLVDKNVTVVPCPVELRSAYKVKTIACGLTSSVFVCDGHVYVCGDNLYTQWASMAGLGDVLTSPTSLPVDYICIDAAVGDDFVLIAVSEKALDKRSTVTLPAAQLMLQKADSTRTLSRPTDQGKADGSAPASADGAAPADSTASPTPATTTQPAAVPNTTTLPPVSFATTQAFFAPMQLTGIVTHQPPGLASNGSSSASNSVSTPQATPASTAPSASNTPSNSVSSSSSPAVTPSSPQSTSTTSEPAQAAPTGRRPAGTFRQRTTTTAADFGGVPQLLDKLATLEAENERLRRELEEAVTELRTTKSENEMLYIELNTVRSQLPQASSAAGANQAYFTFDN